MSDRPVKLILVDNDSLWRLGLITALSKSVDNLQTNLQIIAEAGQLEELINLELTSIPDVLILGITSHYLEQFWQPCQRLRQRFPSLSILLLSIPLAPEKVSQVRGRGINGYCLRTEAIDTILTAINQVAQGESFWSNHIDITLVDQQFANKNLDISTKTTFLYSQAITGVRQIDEELERINSYLQQSQLSNLNWLFWTGKRRELLAARWLIKQFLPIEINYSSSSVPLSELEINRNNSGDDSPNYSSSLALTEINEQSIVISNIGTKICESIQLRLGNNLVNLTGNYLELDILSPRKKQDLLAQILQEFITLYTDLSLSQVKLEYIIVKKDQLLQDLWRATTTSFFGKYSSLSIGTEELELVSSLLLDEKVIQTEILEKIPCVEELLSQILFGADLTIDNTTYPGESGEAIARAELILENLIIQVANAVLQPLLNRFSEVETIKLAFYDQKLLSARDITKFRNDISWKYRLDNYFYEPKLIFESSYKLYVFSELGIRTTNIYAPRSQELQSLTGLRYFFTLWLELKDAIAPRLKTITSFLGQSLVYVLTQIIGRGLGLVGKGILQGIGNSFQEVRAGKGARK